MTPKLDIVCLQQRGVATTGLRWPSIFAIHFKTSIPRPALCNARAGIYGGIRASNRALNPHLGEFL